MLGWRTFREAQRLMKKVGKMKAFAELSRLIITPLRQRSGTEEERSHGPIRLHYPAATAAPPQYIHQSGHCVEDQNGRGSLPLLLSSIGR